MDSLSGERGKNEPIFSSGNIQFLALNGLKSFPPHRLESLCHRYLSWFTDGPKAHEHLQVGWPIQGQAGGFAFDEVLGVLRTTFPKP